MLTKLTLTQSVKVWWSYNVSNRLLIWKFPKETQLNQRTFLNMQSHLACWHTKMCTLMRNTIFENLVKIKYFRHADKMSIMCENTQKNEIKPKRPSITCSCIWYICAIWFDTYFVKVWYRYVLPNTNAVQFCDVIFRHRAMFSTCPNKETRKSKNRPRYDISGQNTVLLANFSGL